MIARSARALGLGGIALVFAATSMPVAAQDNSETRIRKLESEVRALQRKVFPGGDGRYFEPEISAPAATQQPATTSAPSTTAVTDILTRLDALENQLQRLTAQYEVGSNALRLLEERIEVLEAANAPAPALTPAQAASPASSSPAASGQAASAQPAAARPDPARLAAVQEITKPQTNDPGDDEYSYGFRLWDAGFFPEAQQQLTLFVEKYPDHSRATFGRNLLGRAYLDDGKPSEAAPWFLKNYQADKNGARAGDSLLYLAESMIALKDTQRACIALSEFGETYPALATGRLQGQYATARSKVTCN